ncbi:MAG TPA: helix-turn-helix domain-containing protein [Kofleriaceae bacterium]|nr:helix-turn-helix domain-containing protein [Kofleriaceae bacterium]
MKRAEPAEFTAAPIGRHVVGRTYVLWCASPELAGAAQWGVPDARDVRELMALMDLVRHPGFAPAGSILMDLRAVERVDPETLMGFMTLAREWLPRWSPRIARQAVIVPAGMGGLLLAGALPLLEPGHPFRFVADPAAAFDFLACPGAAEAHAEIERVVEAARGGASLLGRVRAALARDLAGATVAHVAAAVKLSDRSLQRSLTEQGTSFTDELRRARVAAAAELLRIDPDLKTEVVAARVGFGSAGRLAAALRRELGVSAAELRRPRS